MSDELAPESQARLGAWLASRAPAEVPASFADRIASIPRSPAPARRERLKLVPAVGRRSPSALLAAVVATSLAILGGGLFFAASQPDKGMTTSPETGRLLYSLAGDIYLADQDGKAPTMVGADSSLFEAAPWAPDGHHFLSYDDSGGTADIRAADGQRVASFKNRPGFGGYPVWSPDSARLQAWADGFRQISIYGIDGRLERELPIPMGYVRFRETVGVWAPDGRSVWVRLAYGHADIVGEVWELPIDGSTPRELPALADAFEAMGGPVMTRDGSRMAYAGGGNNPLYVASADGTDPRPVVRGGGEDPGQAFPAWSPDGERLAYFVWPPDSGSKVDVRIVDVAAGIVRAVVPDWPYDGARFSWSPDGKKILLSRADEPGPRLWTVGIDGGEATLLVAGASQGQWQPAPPRPASSSTP